MSELRKSIERAINQHCAENGSNTPDFILAEYLTDCLAAFDKAANARQKWHGIKLPAPFIDPDSNAGESDDSSAVAVSK